jgi:hypothetical protein
LEKSVKDLTAILYCSSFSSPGTSFSAAKAKGKVRTGKIFKAIELLPGKCRVSGGLVEIDELHSHTWLESRQRIRFL